MEQSCELCTDIRGRGGASNVHWQPRMSPSHRQAVKCALILVQSKLSILRAVDKHEPSLTLRVTVNKS